MDLKKLFAESERLFRLYQLKAKGWTFGLNERTVRRVGQCWHEKRYIEISHSYAYYHTDAQVIDVLLHEIAHALVGPKHHHDSRWRETARKIGCKGERCAEVDVPVPGKYQAECCGITYHLHKRLKRVRYVCRVCKKELIF